MAKISWNEKIKFLQLLCFIGGPLVLLLNFNVFYLLYSIIASWFIVHIGISVGMHRCFAHCSWKPKNKFIEIIIHFLSTINVVGSSITWVGTHRLHHETADTDNDPHKIAGQPFLVKLKYWFNFWPSHRVSPLLIKDLMEDPIHKFFHRNYFKILFSYMAILALIDINLFLYGFIVTTMFSLHTISWITVGAHIIGTKQNPTLDDSRNTFIMGLFMWGEGWHNNHHYKPTSYEFGQGWKQPDIGKHLIRIIAKPESLKAYSVIKR